MAHRGGGQAAQDRHRSPERRQWRFVYDPGVPMKGYAAYDRVQNTTEGPRQVEYRLLAQVTSALRAAKAKPDDRPGFYNALVWNKKVWDAFLCDLVDDRNQLP